MPIPTRRILVLLTLSCALSAAAAHASTAFGGGDLFSPRVPVSAFSSPASWLDPSRLRFSTSVSVGSGFGGTQGLQVTSLSYQFKAPLAMRVSVGNAFGSAAANRNGSFFLEGLDVAWRPSKNSIFQVSFHDYRSPLQYGRDPFYRSLWDY
jgi:hypothetical protein